MATAARVFSTRDACSRTSSPLSARTASSENLCADATGVVGPVGGVKGVGDSSTHVAQRCASTEVTVTVRFRALRDSLRLGMAHISTPDVDGGCWAVRLMEDGS